MRFIFLCRECHIHYDPWVFGGGVLHSYTTLLDEHGMTARATNGRVQQRRLTLTEHFVASGRQVPPLVGAAADFAPGGLLEVAHTAQTPRRFAARPLHVPRPLLFGPRKRVRGLGPFQTDPPRVLQPPPDSPFPGLSGQSPRAFHLPPAV